MTIANDLGDINSRRKAFTVPDNRVIASLQFAVKQRGNLLSGKVVDGDFGNSGLRQCE